MFSLSAISGLKDQAYVFIQAKVARQFDICLPIDIPCDRFIRVRVGELRDRLEMYPEISERFGEDPDCGCVPSET